MSTRRLILTLGALTGSLGAGYGVMFTVLDDYRDKYHIASGALGFIVSIGFLAAFFCQLFIAPRADRGHARQLVIAGILLNVIGLILMAVSKSLPGLLVGRVLMGMGGGTAGPAVRRIAILADPENFGPNLGLLLSCDVSGFALGPALSAVLVGRFGLGAPYLVLVVMTIVTLPAILSIHIQESVEPPKERFAFDLFRIKPFVGALTMGSAAFVMIGTFDALWVLVLDDLHSSDWIKNLGITLFAVPLIILGPSSGRWAQRFGPFRVLLVGLSCGATFMFLYGQMPTAIAMFSIAMVHALNDGATISAGGIGVSMTTPPERQAGAQGLMGGTQTLVAGIMAVVAGQLYQHFGRVTAYTTCAVLMLVLVAVGWGMAGSYRGLRGDATVDLVQELPELVV